MKIERLPIQCNVKMDDNKTYQELLKEMGIIIVDEKCDELFMKVQLPEGWKIEHKGGYWSYLLDEKGRERGNMFTKLAFWDTDAFFNFSKRFSISGEVADYDTSLFEQKPKFIQDGFEMAWEKPERGAVEYHEDGTVSIVEKTNEGMFFYRGGNLVMKQVQKPKMVPNPDYVPMTGYEKYSQPFHYNVLDCDGTILFSSSIVKTEFEHTKEKHWEFYDHRGKLEEQAKQECFDWLNTNYPNWRDSNSYWD